MAWKSREEGPITVEWLVFGIQNVVAFEAEVTAETRLDELGFDWLNLVELEMDLDMHFGVDVPDEEPEWVTVGDVKRTLWRLQDRWLGVEGGGSLKACPRCLAPTLEGFSECSACGHEPKDDTTWREQGPDLK